MIKTDVLILGAGAAGLMCAIEAGKRGRDVIVLDHANKPGKKILMSGGGRCNFTNLDITADNFISHNPHFCKSALSRYTQWDFIGLVNVYGIAYHERDLGKLFCDDSAKSILGMLLAECNKVNPGIRLACDIRSIDKVSDEKDGHDGFVVTTSQGNFQSASLVVATGGLSIPKMCATPLGYKIAEQFEHHIWPTSAGLVPLTLQPLDKDQFTPLSGIAVHGLVANQRHQFKENILFTHRGLSGPAILQLSSYWRTSEEIHINLLPDIDLIEYLKSRQSTQGRSQLKTVLTGLLPKRLIAILLGPELFDKELMDKPLQEISQAAFSAIAEQLQHWRIKPNGTEGYRTAEVTLGGVDCNELSSKTMESTKVAGLYFIGEVVDITGWLGGYNFQWAWSSGWCAGQAV